MHTKVNPLLCLCSILAFTFSFIHRAKTIPENIDLATTEHVILLHGLARSPQSLKPMARALEKAGYHTHLVSYPSRTKKIQSIVTEDLDPIVQDLRAKGIQKIHFVTHSMGGILVRDYLNRHKLSELGRVVMLAPPNQGSEVVDCIGHWRLFKAINGPAGNQLRTGDSSFLSSLGPANFPVGIIAGDRSINPINSQMIPGTDDGKVSVEHTKLEGMTDHIVLHHTHPMIMKSSKTIELTLNFLKYGKFSVDP